MCLGDAFFTAAAMYLAVTLRLGVADGLKYLNSHWASVVTTWAVFIISFYLAGLYESSRLQRIGATVAAAVIAVALGTVASLATFYASFTEHAIGRGIFGGYAIFVFVAVLAVRMLYLMASNRSFMQQRCLIIGSNGEAKKAIELVEQHPHSGIRILGLIHSSQDKDKIGKFINGYPILGGLDAVEKFVQLYDIERLIIAASVEAEPDLLRRLRSFRYRGMALVDFVSLYEELAQEIPLDHINDEWLMLASMNNSRIHIRRLKRLTDLVASIFCLALTWPVLLVTAILIKLTSKGPVLFRQERLGRDCVPFTVLKFRTMREDAESLTGPIWATEDDPRITGLGRWLRKFRIDELPQMFNVLRGEMSLVGPRPERAVFIHKLSEKVPFYSERLLVPPGITGWAQVMAPYAASIEDSRRKLQFDLYYIKHMSFFLDVVIFFRTIKTILYGRERAKTPKLKQPKQPPYTEVKTETLFFNPESAARAAKLADETDERRRTQRLA
jgi:exopolysaccharide biosynthesis polyprenyl glycosylphosphotransferase